MKNNKELNALNAEIKALNDQAAQLNEEDLTLAVGGAKPHAEFTDNPEPVGAKPKPRDIDDILDPIGLPEGKVITGDELTPIGGTNTIALKDDGTNP